jgi:putative RecB family exonuclease
MTAFYGLQVPTVWAAPPKTWNNSTLNEASGCPRRWQLVHSRWGELEAFPTRQHPAAIEGQIVHEALERLARATGQRGNPAFETPAFLEAATEADFFGGFVKAVNEWKAKLDAHPRPGPVFRLQSSPQELANRAVRLFREQYRPGTVGLLITGSRPRNPGGTFDCGVALRSKGGLSELWMRHPSLPFVGILDRVHLDTNGVHIIDFKVGRASDAHQLQLYRYAVLWWRNTGEVPTKVSAQYLDGVKSWPVDETSLTKTEQDVAGQIASINDLLRAYPAKALTGSGCRWCPVRARCSEGWVLNEEAARTEGRADMELTAMGAPGPHGFLARDRSGSEIAVVYETAVAGLLPMLGAGQIVRVVDGVWRGKGHDLEIKPWTEIYIWNPNPPHDAGGPPIGQGSTTTD